MPCFSLLDAHLPYRLCLWNYDSDWSALVGPSATFSFFHRQSAPLTLRPRPLHCGVCSYIPGCLRSFDLCSLFNVESVMTLISSLGNDDVIVVKHVELINGARRTSWNSSLLMVNLLFFSGFIVKHWSFTSRNAEKCHTFQIPVARKLFTLGVNSIIETCGVTSFTGWTSVIRYNSVCVSLSTGNGSRGRGATGSRGSIDPHFSRCWVHIWRNWPLSHFLSCSLVPICSHSYSIHSFVTLRAS